MIEDLKINLDYEQSFEIVEKIYDFLENEPDFTLKVEKSLINLYNPEETHLLNFKFPVLFPPIGVKSLTEYLDSFPEYPPNYLILLIQAGSTTIGHFEEGEMLNHKVIRKYMVRQKQGKAQISHLKTRGKSKLGSRIRLQNTIEFFEEINQKLWDWEIDEGIDKIFYSASINIWNMLFESKVETPFDKKDERIIKIPLDVQTPNYEEMLKVDKFLKEGTLEFFDEEIKEVLGF